MDESKPNAWVVVVSSFGLNEVERNDLFDRVADAAHEFDEEVTVTGCPDPFDEIDRLRAERAALAAALAVVEEALAAYWEHNPPGTPGYNPAVAEALDLLTSRVVLAEHAEEPT